MVFGDILAQQRFDIIPLSFRSLSGKAHITVDMFLRKLVIDFHAGLLFTLSLNRMQYATPHAI